MFYFLLENLFNLNEEIRSKAQQSIIELRDSNTSAYTQELLNIITPNCSLINGEQKSIQPRIQQASIVLLGQIITNMNYLEKANLDQSFFKKLSTALFPKLNLEDYNLAHTSAIVFGESLSILARYSNQEVIPNLINMLQSSISSNNKNIHLLLISVITFINSTNLTTDQTIQIFQALFQIFQIKELSNKALQAITAMSDNISETFNIIPQSSSTNPIIINNEYQSFISTLMQFFSQLLQITASFEENKVSCYNCFRSFFKQISLSFVQQNLDKVLQIAISDIATSMNESVLLASIHFLKTVLRREKKMEENGDQFTPFFNFKHFDLFLMPLIRVYSMIPNENIQNLDPEAVEYETPYLAAEEMIVNLVAAFPEHAGKILIPLIVNLSSISISSSQPFSFSYLGANIVMNPSIAIEISLVLLSLIICNSTNLPPTDFIISFLGSTISSPSTRIRYASISALRYYLEREIKSIDVEDDELINIYKKLILLLPELTNHVLNENSDISCCAMNAIAKFSVFPRNYNVFPCEIIFPLFLKVMMTQNDPYLISDAIDCLFQIIENREISEVATLIEPVIQFLNISNQRNPGSTINENLRDLIVKIVKVVTIEALPYHNTIYSLLVDKIDHENLLNLVFFTEVFANDFPQAFQNTYEIIMKFLINSDSITDDIAYRNDIVFTCCLSISILSKLDIFAAYVQKTTSFLLNLLVKDNSNLNVLVALSALCLYQKDLMKEVIPTLFQIVSQINIHDFIKQKENEESLGFDNKLDVFEVVASCITIISSCYQIAPNDQKIINSTIYVLQSYQFFNDKSEIKRVLESTIDLLLILEEPLFLEIDKRSNMIMDIIKESAEFDELSELMIDLDKKNKHCHGISDSSSEYEYDE